MAVMLSALRANLPLLLRKIPGTHFCWRPSRHRGHSAAGIIIIIIIIVIIIIRDQARSPELFVLIVLQSYH
jgi:hypothetical protein